MTRIVSSTLDFKDIKDTKVTKPIRQYFEGKDPMQYQDSVKYH